jgi:hypothetical protein
VTPEITTNAQSYERPEGHITGANKEQQKDHSNGESLSDWMRREGIPEVFSMDAAYREFARGFSQPAGVSLPIFPETGEGDLYSFDALPDLDSLAKVQGVAGGKPADELATDFWPEGESVEDFIDAATEGRDEEEDEPDS